MKVKNINSNRDTWGGFGSGTRIQDEESGEKNDKSTFKEKPWSKTLAQNKNSSRKLFQDQQVASSLTTQKLQRITLIC